MKKQLTSLLLALSIALVLLPRVPAEAAPRMYSLTEQKLTYQIVVKTSNIDKAGTDAKIYAALSSVSVTPVTDSGNSEDYRLASLTHGDGFEKNYTDTCTLRANGALLLSPIYFQLSWVSSGTAPGWHCEWIEVIFQKGAKEFARSERIPVNRWFEKKRG